MLTRFRLWLARKILPPAPAPMKSLGKIKMRQGQKLEAVHIGVNGNHGHVSLHYAGVDSCDMFTFSSIDEIKIDQGLREGLYAMNFLER